MDAEALLVIQQQRSYPYSEWVFSNKSPQGISDSATAKKVRALAGIQQATCSKLHGTTSQCVITVDTKSVEKKSPSPFHQTINSLPAVTQSSIESESVKFGVNEHHMRSESKTNTEQPSQGAQTDKLNINMQNHTNPFKLNHSKKVPASIQQTKRSIDGLSDDMFTWSKETAQ